MAHLRPTSIEPYASVALTDDERRERTRLYVVVVHGTTLGGQPGSWFQREARDPGIACPATRAPHRQPDGGMRAYEFMSQLAELDRMVEPGDAAGDEPPSPISP